MENDSIQQPGQQGGDSRVSLRVLGLSYSQLQGGAYALILAQNDGPMRIPVVIGPSEAQAIAISMEGIKPPRPLTHDLFVSVGHAFGIRPVEVMIYRFEDGIFYSEITFTDSNDVTAKIDARTSDAIAIAMRFGTPIYTTEEVMNQTAFELEEVEEESVSESESTDSGSSPDIVAGTAGNTNPKLENLAIEELDRMLARLIDNEEYEEAARISEIIKRKRGS